MKGADPRDRVDAFRYNGRTAWGLIVLLGLLLALTVVAALVGPGFDPASRDPLWLVAACLMLLALIGGFVWLARRRPVMLRVGPEGLDLPVGFRRPLPWARIHRIRASRHRTMTGAQHWLRVDPSPGTLPDYRLAAPPQLERWWLRQGGLRIALHVLDAPAEEVIGSIERFRPVTRED